MKPTPNRSFLLSEDHPLRATQRLIVGVAAAAPKPRLEPADLDQARNPLRPTKLADMVGQEKLKPLLRRLIDATRKNGPMSAMRWRPMDHLLLVGASGTGKSTTAMIVARELGTRVFMLKAPLDLGTLEELRDSAVDGDVVFVDEIHMQVSGDRRGLTQACDPESFYHLLEDGVLAGSRGPQTFPRVTWIGATTDVGLLPEALSNRFPIQPRLAPYTEDEMSMIAVANMNALKLAFEPGVQCVFARASRLNPRQVNSYVRSAGALGAGRVRMTLAREVVEDLAGTTLDGLTPSMQTVLRFLYQRCRRDTKAGTTYSASVNTLATACGHGRDTKAISLLVEPWLLQVGLLEVRHQGRTLTDAGLARAIQLSAGDDGAARLPTLDETPAARALRAMGLP